jgi:oxidase EvaA
MECDNLVNMDTRTVISGLITSFDLPLDDKEEMFIRSIIKDDTLFNSMFIFDENEYMNIINKINEYKNNHHCDRQLISLHDLKDWTISNYGIKSSKEADFCISFYDISIQGREVTNWSQPLLKACGRATFALIFKNFGNKKKCLIKLKPEIGAFDCAEYGPTIQREPTYSSNGHNKIEVFFDKILSDNNAIIKKYLLSEEGGRFYHEENYNYIIEIDEGIDDIPDDYCWVNISTLSKLMKKNNYLNIQLRNLLSLITFKEYE